MDHDLGVGAERLDGLGVADISVDIEPTCRGRLQRSRVRDRIASGPDDQGQTAVGVDRALIVQRQVAVTDRAGARYRVVDIGEGRGRAVAADDIAGIVRQRHLAGAGQRGGTDDGQIGATARGIQGNRAGIIDRAGDRKRCAVGDGMGSGQGPCERADDRVNRRRSRAGVAGGIGRRRSKHLGAVGQCSGAVTPSPAGIRRGCAECGLSIIDRHCAVGFCRTGQRYGVVGIDDVIRNDRRGRRGGVDLRAGLGQAAQRQVGGIARAVSDRRRVEIDRGRREAGRVLPGRHRVAEGQRTGAGAAGIGRGGAIVER